MATAVEETDPLTTSSTPNPGTSKWSFAPLQSIPRNSEALWNQVDSVYFSLIPQGHELLNALADLLEPLPELSNGLVQDFASLSGQSEVVRFKYAYEKPDVVKVESAPSSPSSRFSVNMVLSVQNGEVGLLSSESLLPWSEVPSRKADKKAPKVSPGVSETPADQFSVSDWKLVDLLSESPMQDSSSNQLELAFLKSELARVNKIKRDTVEKIIAKIQNEKRPNKKSWYDTEQAILNLYEKKPPSSFQSTAAATTAAVAPLTLNALGKVESELPDSSKDNELCCCICGEGDTTDDNDILICDGCSFAAHQHCYFVHDIPDGNWFCQLCSTFHSSKKQSKRTSNDSLSDLLDKTTCCLCLQSGSFVGGGLMKPVNPSSTTPSWAHMKCATWVPEAAFPPDGSSITVISNKEREELRCSICKLKGGHPVQCAFGKCATAFHISCAAQVGLLPEEKSLKNLYCSRHIKIQLKMSPSTSRLLSLRKQDSYMKVVNDKFIAPKIGGSLISPGYDPIVDARQAWILQVVALNPLVVKQMLAETSVGSLLAVEDLNETIPLVKDLNEIVSAENFNKDVFSELNCCCECMRPFTDSDIVLRCESCNLYVHSICFDRAGVPAINVDELGSSEVTKAAKYDGSRWGKSPGIQPITCVRCDIVKTSSTTFVNTHCILCLQMGGIVLPIVEEEDEEMSSDSKPFAHPRCLWWLSASSGIDLRSSPPQQVKSIAASYHFHQCAVCNSRQGCTVRCVRIGCNKRFHISCGFHAGACFTVRSTGDSTGIVAGSRDGSDELEVLEGIKAVVNGGAAMRRTITCWQHEQRGTKRGVVQLGRVRPVVREIARWVPDGMRSQVVELVNQVLLGGGGPSSGETGQRKPRGRPVGATTKSGSSSRRISRDGADSSESEYEFVGGKPSETKRKRQKKEQQPITTVRFVDGEEITCEDEDWEGACNLCGKAWTDSKGQILESIACDKCDQWFHFHCVGIEQAPSGEFVCPKCRS